MKTASLLWAAFAIAPALGAGPTLAQVQRAPVPVTLPQPPPITNATSGALFDAMLAISRAQQTNPQAAQTASFQYAKALQQYHSGDISGAHASALQALSTAAQVPAPVPTLPAPQGVLTPAAGQVPGTQGGLYGADAAAIDADAFLALARGTIDACAARRDPNVTKARRSYAQAARDFIDRNWQGTRVNAKAAIDACARPQ